MNSEMEDLIERWLEGSLEPDQESQLVDWLSEDPSRLQNFVEINIRDQMLRDAASGLSMESQGERAMRSRVPAHRSLWKRASSKRLATAIASLAACLLIAFAWFDQLSQEAGMPKSMLSITMDSVPFVSVVAAHDVAALDVDQSLSIGDRLAGQIIELRSGLLRLLFDDGAEVTLQGPARYELVSLGKTRLHSGLLTATVPPGAEGFQVDTPTAEIVDLGTVFGVELAEDGFAKVSVFDGEVEVKPTGQPEASLVKAGESVQVGDAATIERADLDLKTYEKVWPVASGIVGSTGAFRFAPPWPRPMGLLKSDSEIYVLPEGYSQSLDEPLQVDIARPGRYRTVNELTKNTLSVGTRVKSFLLQFRPLDQSDSASKSTTKRLNPDDIKRIVGEITFDRPVLGLIVRDDQLRLSDGRFSVRGGQVPQRGRALELGGTPRDDVVMLSQDRRTVTLDLAAFGLFSDQVRVIVDHSLEN